MVVASGWLWWLGAACTLSHDAPEVGVGSAALERVAAFPAASDIAWLSDDVPAGFLAPGAAGGLVWIDGVQTALVHDIVGYPKAYAAADGVPLVVDMSRAYTWTHGELRQVFLADPTAAEPSISALDKAGVVPVPGGAYLLGMYASNMVEKCCTLADWPAGALGPRAVSPGAVALTGMHRGAPLVLDRQRRLHRLLGRGDVQTLSVVLPEGLTVSGGDAVRGDRLLVHGEHGGYANRNQEVEYPADWFTHVFVFDLVTGALDHLGEMKGAYFLDRRASPPDKYVFVVWSDHDRHTGTGHVGRTAIVDVDSLKPTSTR
jgi:hypothetical protein